MPLSLFGYRPKSRFEDRIGFESKHAHTFGGQASDFGIEFADAPLPLHLIYRVDLRDPMVPIELKCADFLPLLQCFNYGTECCYQIKSDTEIKLIKPQKQERYFPPWEAPATFKKQSTSFAQQSFDPTNADDVMNWKGVFGWDELVESERERAIELARQQTSLNVEENAPDSTWTYADVIDCCYDPPFAQSRPGNRCKNPDCDNDSLRVIALQNDVVADELIWPDEYVQTIWQMCTSCDCVTVSNQCT